MQSIPPRHIPPGIIIGGAIVLLVPIIGAGAWLWLQWEALAVAVPWLAMTLRILLFVVPPAYALAFVWQRWGRTRFIEAYHETQRMRAEYQHPRQYPNIIEGELVSAPALPAPVVKAMPEWLHWVDTQPHCLLAGKTKAGKTHTATALLAQRLRAGEAVYIVDPHSSAWMGLPTVGFVGMLPDGKPDTADLNKALMAVAAEYISRMRARDDRKNKDGNELAHDHFGRLTVLIDEANYIADVLPTVWREFIKALASGGRKVGVALIVLAQSALVEDIGCSGGMRANFARLGLDDYTVKQLIGSDEKDSDRKRALYAALIGRERPAGATIDSQVWLLDRSELSAGSAPAGARDLVWRASSVSVQSDGRQAAESGKETSNTLPAPDADTSMTSILPTAAEIATIAARLGSLPPSKVAETLDGYHPRKYIEYKAKVDYVQALLGGKH